MGTLLLGIDVGTTGSKAILVRPDGSVASSVTTEYPLSTPFPLWAEQHPADWWKGTAQSIREALAQAHAGGKDVAAIGLTGQMHGLVLLDARGEVLRPSILWNDQRTGGECAEITRLVGARRLLELTGNPVLPGFTAPKIVWVRTNEPEVYRRIAHVLLPKDYIRFRLSGEQGCDVSDASGTSLFDVEHRCWSGEMLQALGVPSEWMPPAAESALVTAYTSSEAAAATGLVKGTPIVAGAGDQAAQAVGSGIVEEGLLSVTTGTSGVVFASSDRYRAEPEGRLHAFCHAVPGRWHLMGVMLSAGGSFRWYRDTFGEAERRDATASGHDPYDLLTTSAESVPPGAEGLLFLPYLTGERTPYPNPDARGVFFGITLRHTHAHFTRAVLEGVTFGLLDSLDLMRAAGITPKEVRVSGGGARSPLWRRIMADVFGTTVNTVNVTEGAAFGAALLAGAGAGIYTDVLDACRRTIAVSGSTRPGPASPVYPRFHERYRALYRALEMEFTAVTDLVRSPQSRP